MSDNWSPRVGQYAKLSCFSVGRERKLTNIRLVTVREVHGGEVHVSGNANPFRRNGHGKFEEKVRPNGIVPVTLIQYIDRATDSEIKSLPRDKTSGRLYAEQVQMGTVRA